MLLTAAIIIICLLLEHVSRFAFSAITEISYNSGVAFGIFRGIPDFALILSCAACVMIFSVLIFFRLKSLTRTGLAIMAGGALSNLLERIFLGHVIDWIPFPVFIDLNFNLADIEISLGALIAFISCIK